MEQTPTTQPHSERAPACVDKAWRRARLDCEAGASGPVAAERHGLNARSLRRRAAAKGWRSLPGARTRETLETLLRLGANEGGRLHCAPEAPEVEADGALAPFTLANAMEIGSMLMAPHPQTLARFAFRRSVKSAAAGAPAETAQWLRLVEQLRRAESLLDQVALAERRESLAGWLADADDRS